MIPRLVVITPQTPKHPSHATIFALQMHPQLPITPIHLFLGREVGLEVRRAVVLGAAAVAGVFSALSTSTC